MVYKNSTVFCRSIGTYFTFNLSAHSVQYYHNQDTWLDAQKRCYDLGDRLATNDDGLNCNLVSRHFDSSKRLTYWTGKYKTVSHWISKIDIGARIDWLTSEERCKHQNPKNTADICKQTEIEHPGAWLPIHRVPFWTEVTRASSNNMTKNTTKTLTDSAALYPEILSYESTKSHGTDAQTINAGRKTGLIVGGLLGALAIFSVIILAVILTLRRKKASTKNQNVEKSDISNEDHQRNNLSNNIRVNQLYEDEGARADSPVPMSTKEAEIANVQEGKKPIDVYAVVMKNNKPSPLQLGLKPVVASADDVESEYDRMNITPNFLEDNMENNLYDSSIADRCESDPTYNTATNTRHSRINTEDVYN
ncbi:unnamed protein product [Mytilus edulis]|uniref:C-type lectin domain-containing protein n=1 Tax=Mytilus edulis TaxID=6550 RepID=A0A8S3UGF5_MYTED|nr:unnamed protein product [Mytilus edulis]